MSSSTTTNNHALSGVEKTVGKDLMKAIQESKILLVGAGGIGCELLKNLALSGFRRVETIDLDTIDVSNLNRQFLFRSQHVGMPKCTVACQVAANMAPDAVEYIAHHGNVCDNDKFNVQYVSQFNLVLNALDNVVARRRVNRLCLAASVPLIEAGTTGYLGQVKVIDKASNVACYECVTQETQKVYPICTIRSTPSMPVHTIVWAKELYKLLFGDKVEESMLFEDPSSEDVSTYMDTVTTFRSRLASGEFSQRERVDAAKNILTTMFCHEVTKQIDMGRFKTAKKTPTPLNKADIAKGTSHVEYTPDYDTASIWSIVKCMQEFTCCLLAEEAASPAFDKDDPMAMRFVTAAANLRSHVFGIEPLQSVYSAKGIAGNIIPAIATTNAIVAGLQVLQAFHILQAQLESTNGDTTTATPSSLVDKCRYLDVVRNKSGRPGYYITSNKLDKPNPKCFVCRNATIPLTLNVEKWNLQQFLAEIVKKKLGFEEPTIMLDGDIIYEEGDEADTAMYASNLDKSLPALPCGGIQNGTVLRIEDFSQELEVDVAVTHCNVWEPEEDDEEVDEMKFVVGGEAPKAKAAAAENGNVAKMPEAKASPAAEEEEDEIEVIDMDEDKKPSAKRSSDEAFANGGLINGLNKRAKVDEVIVID
jgi:ubiquitin-like 1-activating enzyme E1 B